MRLVAARSVAFVALLTLLVIRLAALFQLGQAQRQQAQRQQQQAQQAQSSRERRRDGAAAAAAAATADDDDDDDDDGCRGMAVFRVAWCNDDEGPRSRFARSPPMNVRSTPSIVGHTANDSSPLLGQIHHTFTTTLLRLSLIHI